MASSIRVLFTPVPSPAGEKPTHVHRARLALARMGPEATLAQRGTAQPATLSFHCSRLKRGRKPEEREQALLATLSGSLQLNLATGAPEFSVDPGADALQHVEPPSEAVPVGSSPRRLQLELSAPSFRTSAPGSGLFLILPEDPEALHLEIDVELQIAGQAESPLGDSDPLDVPLVPREIFQLRLVDEVGEALSGVELEFEAEGILTKIKTDDNGLARVDSVGASSTSIRFLALEPLRETLRQRWDKPREGARLLAGPSVVVLPVRELESPFVMLVEERLTVSIQPRVVLARMKGLLFETNKSFLLPSALPDLRRIKQLYDQNPKSKLLVVGHTDTTADASVNDPLSFERAESMGAILKDDVDVWVGRYKSNIAASRRWGQNEDLQMIAAVSLLAASGSGTLDEATVRGFQKLHNNLPPARQSKTFATLDEDGVLGDETRKQLIADYMNQDETTLPDDVELVLHGAGENFPLDASGTRVDATPENPKADARNRRVELFFFPEDFGVQPPPPGKNSKPKSKEYPEWRRRADQTFEFDVRANGPLEFSTPAPSAGQTHVLLQNAAGEVFARLGQDQGFLEDDVVHFAFLPEVLPARTSFQIFRDERFEYDTGLIDPVALRDALFDGDMTKAQDEATSDNPDELKGDEADDVIEDPDVAETDGPPGDPLDVIDSARTIPAQLPPDNGLSAAEIAAFTSAVSSPEDAEPASATAASAFAEPEVQNADAPPTPTGARATLVSTNVLGSPRAGVTQVAGPPPQRVRVVVTWKNTRHRFLTDMVVTLTAVDGKDANTALAQAAGSRKGRLTFEVDDSVTKLTLLLTIDGPNGRIEQVRQRLKIKRDPDQRPALFDDGFTHPRVQHANFGANKPAFTLFTLDVDLVFLDVTGHLLATPGVTLKAALDFLTANGFASTLRVLEHTGGLPRAWPVILPPTLVDKVDQGVVLFLKNEALDHVQAGEVVEGAYTTVENADYVRALFGYWASPKVPGKYLGQGDASKPNEYDPYPNFGWDRQLRDSGKSALVLFPIPHGISFGVLESPSQTATKSLLQSAITCLTARARLRSGTATSVKVGHVAVGAWSSGTDTLFRWLRPFTPAANDLVKEFWIFDGKNGFPNSVGNWFIKDKTRRLRMLGTAYTEQSSNLLASLLNDPNATAIPNDPTFWYTSSVYKAALTNASGQLRRFPGPVTDPTTVNGVVFVSETGPTPSGGTARQALTLQFKRTQGTLRKTSQEEAALMAAESRLPVTTGREFLTLILRITVDPDPKAGEKNVILRHRHPWSTMGVTPSGGRLIGHFQKCLEDSGF